MNNDIEWKIINLAKNCTIKARIGWQGLRSDEYRKRGDFLLITGTDFENGFINYNTCSYVDEWRYLQDANIQLKNDDVLITKDGTIGKIAFVKGLEMPATLNSGIFVIRPKGNTSIYPEYLSLVFKSTIFTDFLDRITAGSTIVHLYQKDIVKFDFPIPYKNGEPDLETQKLIAQKLGDMDSLIAAKEKLLAKKRDLKIGAMQKLIKQEESENWLKVKLNNCGVFSKGKGISKSESNTGTIPAVRYGELYTKHENYIKAFYSFISKSVAESSHRLNQGDILFTASGETKEDIGKCVAFVDNFEAYAGGDLIILSPFENYDSKFLGLTLNSDYIKKQKAEVAQGDAIVHIRTAALQDLNVILPFTSENKPDFIEQKRIASILTDMDIDIASIEKELVKLRNLKTAMMQKMFCFKEVVE